MSTVGSASDGVARASTPLVEPLDGKPSESLMLCLS